MGGEEEKVKVDRKTFDALCVFAGVSVVQAIVPSPLDYLLLPGAVSYWFVSSGQDSWIIDTMYEKGKILAANLNHIKNDYMKKMAAENTEKADILQDNGEEEGDLSGYE